MEYMCTVTFHFSFPLKYFSKFYCLSISAVGANVHDYIQKPLADTTEC